MVDDGTFALSDDAETFGAGALGLLRDESYAALCGPVDQLGGPGGGSV